MSSSATCQASYVDLPMILSWVAAHKHKSGAPKLKGKKNNKEIKEKPKCSTWIHPNPPGDEPAVIQPCCSGDKLIGSLCVTHGPIKRLGSISSLYLFSCHVCFPFPVLLIFNVDALSTCNHICVTLMTPFLWSKMKRNSTLAPHPVAFLVHILFAIQLAIFQTQFYMA